jgi:hypothetical protein
MEGITYHTMLKMKMGYKGLDQYLIKERIVCVKLYKGESQVKLKLVAKKMLLVWGLIISRDPLRILHRSRIFVFIMTRQ